MADTPQSVEVTQEDREAARWYHSPRCKSLGFASSPCTCTAVDAFAHHRTAAEARASAASEARVRELEAALEPFAAVLDGYDPEDEDDAMPGTLVIGSVTDYSLTLGDLRAARTAYLAGSKS